MQRDTLFEIDAEARAAFPGIKVGVGVIQGVMVRRELPAFETAKKELIAEIRDQLQGKPLAELPRVQAFRRIYRRFGVDPGSRRPSAEALLRRVIDPTKDLYRINTVVDACNLSSVEHQLPMAAYDLDRVALPILLRFAKAGESFRGIGQEQPEPLTAGELVYADQRNILCRDFNYRDADATKVEVETQNLIIFVDGCAEVSAAELTEALESVAMRIVTFNSGVVESMKVYGLS